MSGDADHRGPGLTRLSSLLTPHLRWMLLTPWALAAGGYVLALLPILPRVPPAEVLGSFALVLIVPPLLLLYVTRGLKQVFADRDGIVVKERAGEVRIPYSQVYAVKDHRWFNPRFITIRLKAPCELGDRIVFLPRLYLWMPLWQDHPAAALLSRRAREAWRGQSPLDRRRREGVD